MAEESTDPTGLNPGRLRRLRHERDAAHDALRGTAERLREARSEMRELEARQAKNAERDAALTGADAQRLAELQDEVAALAQYHAELQDEHRNRARLVARCEVYMEGL